MVVVKPSAAEVIRAVLGTYRSGQAAMQTVPGAEGGQMVADAVYSEASSVGAAAEESTPL